MQITLKYWRVALIVYGFQFLLALTLGAQAYHILEASIGSSLELNKLMHGYDHTVFSDFLNVHGASITPLLGQLRWLLLVNVIFSAFLNAGLLHAVYKEDATWSGFWRGAAAYFWPFLRINLFFLFCTALLAGFLFVPFASKWTDLILYFPSEKYVVWLLYALIAFFLIKIAAWYAWSLFAKMHIMEQNDERASFGTKHLKAGWKVYFRFFWKSYKVLIVFVSLLALVYGVYWLAETRWGMTTPLLIVLFFIFQQMLVFFRLLWRLGLYRAFLRMSNSN